MPNLTREEVKRGLAYIEAHEYLKARGALSDKLPTQYEALQTALSLYVESIKARLAGEGDGVSYQYVCASDPGCRDGRHSIHCREVNAYRETTTLRARIATLTAQLEQAREALKNLVRMLRYVHSDDEYRAVWTIAQLHRGPYAGPSYATELDAADAALQALREGGEG